MRKIKGLICALAASAVMMSAMFIPTAQAGVREQDAKIDFLINVGIMDPITDEQIQLVDTVKRKDFAVLMTRMLRGGQDAVDKSQCDFTDIDYADPTTPDVIYAYQNNIMNGYGDGKFYPEVAVRYEEAVKCVVCVLGYSSEAEIRGGYPNGYMQTAMSLSLLDGVGAASGEFIGLKDLAMLLYNCLDVPYMTVKYSNGQPQYVKEEGHTVLSDSFDMYEGKGIITGNSKTSLDADAEVSEGNVIINGEVYGTGATNAESFIGQYVKFYYINERNSDDKTLSFLYAPDNKNNILTVDSDNIADMALAVGGGVSTFKYYTEGTGKSVSVKISPTADVILNGKACMEYSSETFMPETGSVTLIDNTGDGMYNVIIIDSSATYVVKNVSPYFGTVTDYYARIDDGDGNILNDKNVVLDIDTEKGGNYITIIKPDGTEGSPEDIQPWDILSVKEAVFGNERNVTVEIARKVVSGQITASDSDTITINGTVYELNNTFKKYIASGIASLAMGVTQEFCLDINGRVAAIKENNSYGDYYYINKSYDADNGEGNVIISAWKISEDEWETYELEQAKKISIDGVSSNVSAVKSLEQCFVRIIKNTKGEITKIYKCKAEFEAERNLQRSATAKAYIDSSSGGEVCYYSGSNTVGVTIPESDEYATDKSMYVKSIANFGDTRYKYVQLYDVENYVPAIIVYKSNVVTSSESVGFDKASMVVTGIEEEMYDDEVYTKIAGYSSNGKVSYLIDSNVQESDAFKSLQSGDFVRFETNLNGIGTAMSVDYSSETKSVLVGNVRYKYGSTFTDLNIFCGRIAEINQAANILKIEHSYGDGITSSAVSVIRIPSVVLVNDSSKSGSDQFELTNGSALKEGQFIAVRRKAGANQIAEVFVD